MCRCVVLEPQINQQKHVLKYEAQPGGGKVVGKKRRKAQRKAGAKSSGGGGSSSCNDEPVEGARYSVVTRRIAIGQSS